MNNRTLIAIDPGKAGGFAVQWTSGEIHLFKMPQYAVEVCNLIDNLCKSPRLEKGILPMVAVEKVGGYIGKQQPGSAMFRFGYGVGVIHGCLLTHRASLLEVTPQAWMKHVGAGTKKSHGLSGPQWKRHLLDLARKRHPVAEGLNLHTADACLILDWLRAQP